MPVLKDDGSLLYAAHLVIIKVGGLFAILNHGMHLSEQMWNEAKQAIDLLSERVEAERTKEPL